MNIHTFKAKVSHDTGAAKVTITVVTHSGSHQEATRKAIEQLLIVEKCQPCAIVELNETNFRKV